MYTSSTVRDAVTGSFTTTVTNTLVVETISISGRKIWRDNDNKLDLRPTDLQLKVWYWHVFDPPATPTGEWREVNTGEYTINWTKPLSNQPNSHIWTYTISGFGLAKYIPGEPASPANLRAYSIEEVIPAGGNYELDDADLAFDGSEGDARWAPADRRTNNTLGLRGANDNIVNADFLNHTTTDITSLWVSKERDFGVAGAKFRFQVYVSRNPITTANPGTLYVHHYYVHNGKHWPGWDSLSDDAARIAALNGGSRPRPVPVNIDGVMVPGVIEIEHGQSFVLMNLPQGWHYRVDEIDHNDYDIDEQKSTGMVGRLNMLPENPPSGHVVASSVAAVYNEAIREVSIVNTTPNEGVAHQGANLQNAGGQVTVERVEGSCMPDDWSDDMEVPNALAVLWEPNFPRFWAFGNEFLITFQEFNSDVEHRVRVWDYMNPDGTLKPLAQCRNDNQTAIQRFIRAGASLSFRGDAVILVLSNDVEDMPRSVTVWVEFVPTLAVNNVTEGNAGGTVVVNCVNGTGTPSNNADGVPALGAGMPYIATSVYGVPSEGYEVDWEYIVIRNLNDIEGKEGFVHVYPDENGYFETELTTHIAGDPETVVKTGIVKEGSIIVELDNLPVPLQIDLRFIPEGSRSDQGGNQNYRGAFMPKTGLESIIVVLLFGLLTSLVATAAIVIVIRRQNAKDKGTLGKASKRNTKDD